MNILVVFIGGAIGSVMRYLCSEALLKFTKNLQIISAFPLGTFLVNILGSMVAGFIYYITIKNFDNFDPRLKLFLFSGFLGGFTTFSAFSLDFFRLATAGQYVPATLYAVVSVALSILAVFFGFYLGKIIFS